MEGGVGVASGGGVRVPGKDCAGEEEGGGEEEAKNSVIVGRAAGVHRNFNLVSKFAYDGGVLESN